jgi:hypothetical protein
VPAHPDSFEDALDLCPRAYLVHHPSGNIRVVPPYAAASSRPAGEPVPHWGRCTGCPRAGWIDEGSTEVGERDLGALAIEAFFYGFPLVFNLTDVDRFARRGIGAVPATPYNALMRNVAASGGLFHKADAPKIVVVGPQREMADVREIVGEWRFSSA